MESSKNQLTLDCVLDKSAQAQCSVVGSRCMAQACQLDCWASITGHVIGVSLDSKPVLV